MGTIFAFFWPDPGPARIIGYVIVISYALVLVRLIMSAITIAKAYKCIPNMYDTPQATLASVSSNNGEPNTVQGRLRALSMYNGRKEALDASEALAAQQERAFDASMSWVRYAVSALLFLGLTGTVLGLANTIGNLQPILKSAQVHELKDLDNIVHAISEVVGAMRNAFACTLLGVIFSLLTSFGAQITQWLFQRWIMQPLDAYCSQTFVPFLSQSREYEQFSQAAKDIGVSVIHFDKIVRAEQELLTSFGQKTAASIEAITRSAQVASTILTDAGTKVRQDLVKSSSEAAVRISESGNSLGAQMDKTTHWLSETGVGVHELLRSVNDSQAEIIAAIQATRTNVAPLREILISLQATAEQSLADLHEVFKTGEANIISSTGRFENLFSQHLASMAESYTNSGKHTEQAGTALIELLSSNLAGLNTTLKEIGEQQEALLIGISQFKDTTHVELSDYGKQSLGTLGALLKSQANHSGQMLTITQSQSDSLKKMTADLGQAVSALKSLIQTAENAFRDAVNERLVPGPAPYLNGSREEVAQ